MCIISASNDLLQIGSVVRGSFIKKLIVRKIEKEPGTTAERGTRDPPHWSYQRGLFHYLWGRKFTFARLSDEISQRP